MPAPTSGLTQDLLLIRRRAWLFLPFLALGLVVAFALGRSAGDANATGVLSLDTVIFDAVIGGDRGLRIFEAQSMTADEAFKEKVRSAIGDPNFDMARFAVSLNPISVADGVSRGTLTVSIAAPTQDEALRFRDAWIAVFVQEYTSQEGLFRRQFVDIQRKVALDFDAEFQRTATAFRGAAQGIRLESMLEGTSEGTLAFELNQQEAELRREQAEIEAALTGAVSGGLATQILGIPVSSAEAADTLRARLAVVQRAADQIAARRGALSDDKLTPELRALLDSVRAAHVVKRESYNRLQNSLVAVRSSKSTVDVSTSISGGFAGSPVGRVAVALAVTLVMGLVAIYAWEWLGQTRRGAQG